MKILNHCEAKCDFCGKEKEGVEVQLENGKKQKFCWPDLKRIVKTGLLATPEKKV